MDNVNNKRGLFSATTDFYYLAVNFQSFSTYTGGMEVAFMKMDYNPRLSGIYMCHKWNDVTPSATTVSNTAYSTTPVTYKQAHLFDNKYQVTLDNGLIRLQQVYPY